MKEFQRGGSGICQLEAESGGPGGQKPRAKPQ